MMCCAHSPGKSKRAAPRPVAGPNQRGAGRRDGPSRRRETHRGQGRFDLARRFGGGRVQTRLAGEPFRRRCGAEADEKGRHCGFVRRDSAGLCSANPQRDRSARHIPEVRAIPPEIERMAEGPVSGVSKGGMQSKLAAAKIATSAGAAVVIADGHVLHPLRSIAAAERTTLFVPRVSPAQAKKRWIAGGLSAQGTITIDAGAERALLSGKSLLPAGVKSVTGHFERGDAVLVTSEDGRELARGLIAYNDEDARRLVGRRTVEIESILGYRGRDEMIHRDDLALTHSVET